WIAKIRQKLNFVKSKKTGCPGWSIRASNISVYSERSYVVFLESLPMISYDDGVPCGSGPSVEGVAGMSKSAYYIQECPTCGRSLQIRVEYLGRQVVCQHCRAQFLATD